MAAVFVCAEQRKRRQRKNAKVIRKLVRNTEDPFQGITEEYFISLYRFPKQLCKNLIEELQPFMQSRNRSSAIPSQIRILCALRFFATGCYQRGTGQDFFSSLSQTMVSRCIAEVTKAIEKIADKYVKFPSIEEYPAIKRPFFEIASFPGIIGLIDGTHIKIVAPPNELEHVYYCRKGGHSKNVQIVCDAEYRILNVNARFGGTAHDAYMWKRSILKNELEKRYASGERNFWLLGDSGYPLQPWLMTPILTPSSSSENNFNKAHKITRSVVERCIGILKNRFRCLLKDRVLHYSPEKAGLIINACAVLHNILILAKVPFPSDLFESEQEDHVQHLEQLPNREILRQGRATRSGIVLDYFT